MFALLKFRCAAAFAALFASSVHELCYACYAHTHRISVWQNQTFTCVCAAAGADDDMSACVSMRSREHRPDKIMKRPRVQTYLKVNSHAEAKSEHNNDESP